MPKGDGWPQLQTFRAWSISSRNLAVCPSMRRLTGLQRQLILLTAPHLWTFLLALAPYQRRMIMIPLKKNCTPKPWISSSVTVSDALDTERLLIKRGPARRMLLQSGPANHLQRTRWSSTLKHFAYRELRSIRKITRLKLLVLGNVTPITRYW